EEEGAAAFGRVEEAAQVLLRFADVFADDGREVDAVEVEAEGVGEDLGGHRLARAALAGEEHAESEPAAVACFEAPVAQDAPALLDGVDDAPEEGRLRLGEHEIGPGGARLDAPGEGVEARSGGEAAGIPQRLVCWVAPLPGVALTGWAPR